MINFACGLYFGLVVGMLNGILSNSATILGLVSSLLGKPGIRWLKLVKPISYEKETDSKLFAHHVHFNEIWERNKVMQIVVKPLDSQQMLLNFWYLCSFVFVPFCYLFDPPLKNHYLLTHGLVFNIVAMLSWYADTYIIFELPNGLATTYFQVYLRIYRNRGDSLRHLMFWLCWSCYTEWLLLELCILTNLSVMYHIYYANMYFSPIVDIRYSLWQWWCHTNTTKHRISLWFLVADSVHVFLFWVLVVGDIWFP